MPNKFINSSAVVNTTPGSIVYTSPSGVDSIVHTLAISNNTGTLQQTSVEVIDTSASTSVRIMNNVPVPIGSTVYFPKPINLEQNDAIRVIGSTAAALTAFMSILQVS